jgi:hypothetical protein
MPKRKPVEAESVPVVAEPKKKAVRATTASKAKVTPSKATHKHHSNKTVEAVVEQSSVSTTITLPPDSIASLAYSYWEARGRQGGSAEQDWLQAESDLLKLAQNR